MAVLFSFASVIVVVRQETPGPQWWRSSLHSDTEMPFSKHEGHGDALYISFVNQTTSTAAFIHSGMFIWFTKLMLYHLYGILFVYIQYFVLRFALKQPTHLPRIEISIAL